MKEKADFNDRLILFNLDVSYSERLDLSRSGAQRCVHLFEQNLVLDGVAVSIYIGGHFLFMVFVIKFRVFCFLRKQFATELNS